MVGAGFIGVEWCTEIEYFFRVVAKFDFDFFVDDLLAVSAPALWARVVTVGSGGGSPRLWSGLSLSVAWGALSGAHR